MADLSPDQIARVSGPAKTPEGWFKVTGPALTTTPLDGWALALATLRDMRKQYPHVEFRVVPAKMPRAHPAPERDMPTSDPAELAHVHHREPVENCSLC